jgi:hypothetical protein
MKITGIARQQRAAPRAWRIMLADWRCISAQAGCPRAKRKQSTAWA